MKPTLPALAGYLCLLALPVTAGAQASSDSRAAQYLAANCANCHGTQGRAVGAMPSLAGMPRQSLIEQMTAFRDGKRPATIMHQLAKGYSDQQIALIADYFARQTPAR